MIVLRQLQTGAVVNFGSAIKSGFNGYFDFSGRSSRSELWWWLLFTMIINLGVSLFDGLDSILYGWILLIVGLGLFLPTLAVQVRRLHDLDRAGWWILISLIPLVGSIILLVWACSKGTEGENRFGSDPLC